MTDIPSALCGLPVHKVLAITLVALENQRFKSTPWARMFQNLPSLVLNMSVEELLDPGNSS